MRADHGQQFYPHSCRSVLREKRCSFDDGDQGQRTATGLDQFALSKLKTLAELHTSKLVVCYFTSIGDPYGFAQIVSDGSNWFTVSRSSLPGGFQPASMS